ncbi:chemotaxis protein CheB [Hymenobacter cellulosilyticus]|uniref:chemotaxis protein CheB n=1 Tax=Hymenobacter cellulosilyticus TaxID=2932248 RepID=UPI0021D40B25|nr:chemotaxis protein CheB [Hymenobacter cellulosilyticus]
MVVLHLMPDQPSQLAQVLQQSTSMPVLEATDGQKVRPNHVYVIPPDRDLSILHGTLLLFAPNSPGASACPSTTSSRAWPRTPGSGPCASSCRAWAPTAPWG